MLDTHYTSLVPTAHRPSSSLQDFFKVHLEQQYDRDKQGPKSKPVQRVCMQNMHLILIMFLQAITIE